MGANGAGKSTLVKILTGGVRPDPARSSSAASRSSSRSPAEARRGGIVSVYQEPSLIPDLDVASNLRLTGTPVEPFRALAAPSSACPTSTSRDLVRDLPLAVAPRSSTSPARWRIEPDVLLLDEMTAALPANLTERVLEVVGRQRGTGRSVIFISHRLIEIAAVCDRATVLRDGETVGVVDVDAPASEDRIVDADARRHRAATCRAPSPARRGAGRRRRRRPRASTRAEPALPGTKLDDVSFDLYPGEVAGRRRARGPGPGRAVRHPGRLGAARAAASSSSTAPAVRSAIPPTRSGRASSTSRPTAPRRS